MCMCMCFIGVFMCVCMSLSLSLSLSVSVLYENNKNTGKCVKYCVHKVCKNKTKNSKTEHKQMTLLSVLIHPESMKRILIWKLNDQSWNYTFVNIHLEVYNAKIYLTSVSRVIYSRIETCIWKLFNTQYSVPSLFRGSAFAASLHRSFL